MKDVKAIEEFHRPTTVLRWVIVVRTLYGVFMRGRSPDKTIAPTLVEHTQAKHAKDVPLQYTNRPV